MKRGLSGPAEPSQEHHASVGYAHACQPSLFDAEVLPGARVSRQRSSRDATNGHDEFAGGERAESGQQLGLGTARRESAQDEEIAAIGVRDRDPFLAHWQSVERREPVPIMLAQHLGARVVTARRC